MPLVGRLVSGPTEASNVTMNAAEDAIEKSYEPKANLR